MNPEAHLAGGGECANGGVTQALDAGFWIGAANRIAGVPFSN
jgi:hypothetical protein